MEMWRGKDAHIRDDPESAAVAAVLVWKQATTIEQ